MTSFYPRLRTQVDRGYVRVLNHKNKHSDHWSNLGRGTVTAEHWWVLGFYNCGKHLYLVSGPQRYLYRDDLIYLPFAVYCQGSNCNGVEFRHLGHLYGVNGGPAKVEVVFNDAKFLFSVNVGGIVWLYDNRHRSYIIEQVKPFFPRTSK